MEQVALGSSLNELYFGSLIVQIVSAGLSVALLLYVLNLYGEANFLGYLVYYTHVLGIAHAHV